MYTHFLRKPELRGQTNIHTRPVAPNLLYCLLSALLLSDYNFFFPYLSVLWGRDSSVGIATRYGLEGPGIEFRWGVGGETGPGAHPASYTIGTGSLSRL